MPQLDPPHFSRLAEELIGDLRGVPTIEPRRQVRRPTQNLHEIVDSLLNRYQIGKESREHTIREHWARLVGPGVAHYTHPAHIDERGRLLVLTSNSIVRSELQQQRHHVLPRIQALPGCAGVTALMLRAG
jgi:hypothetical protein